MFRGAIQKKFFFAHSV